MMGLSSAQVWVETVSFEAVQGLALHSGWVLALLPFVSEQSRAESSVSLRLRCQVNRSVRSWPVEG